METRREMRARRGVKALLSRKSISAALSNLGTPQIVVAHIVMALGANSPNLGIAQIVMANVVTAYIGIVQTTRQTCILSAEKREPNS